MTTQSTTPAGEDLLPDETCFDCGSPTYKTRRNHSFVYGTGAAAVDLTVDVPTYVCPSCGLEFLGHEAEGPMHDAVCAHLGVLSPDEIRGIRAIHGMSRADFAAVAGLDEDMLRRWEEGILIQGTAQDRYLRLLAEPSNLRALQRLPAPSPPIVGGQERRTLGRSS